MAGWELVSRSPEETAALGRTLGELAEPGDLYLLRGGLGAGKTALTQGIAAGLGVHDVPSSPTFTLANEYRGRLWLYHIDLYRLDNLEEVEGLGLDEYVYGDGVTVVEWPERGEGLWPPEHLLVWLAWEGPVVRRLLCEPAGARYERLVDGLRRRLEH